MGLKGILTPRGVISGSWLTFNGNYNKLTNKPTLNGVTIEGDKTSEDYHIESGGGGGGGTDNYNDLNNKPQINDVTLSGNKSLDALGIQAKIGFPQDSTKYLDGEGNFTTPPSGGGSYSETVLFENAGTSNPASITLDDSLFNYDIIVIRAVRTFDGVPNSVINTMYLTSLLDVTYILNILGWSGNNEFILYTITNNLTLTLTNVGNALYIDKLIGVNLS